jgi:hypothetical protein
VTEVPPINYKLLQELAEKPHPLLNIAEDFEEQIRTIPVAWVGEVFTSARTAHHLLDLAGIPYGVGYAQDLDSRTWLAVAELGRLRRQLDRIACWHVQATYPGGMIGDTCVECGLAWPCETRRMADGTHRDLADADQATLAEQEAP